MHPEIHAQIDMDVAGPPLARPRAAAPVGGDATLGGRMFEMSDKDRRRPSPSSPEGKKAGSEPMKRRSSLDAGFDTYLSRELHQLYDPVLGEAIPDEMAALLRGFVPRPDDDDGGEGGGGPDQGGCGAKG